MRKLSITMAIVLALINFSSCSDKYREAIVGDWSYSFTSSYSDMTKDKCTVNWTFYRGEDSPEFMEIRKYNVGYNGEDGANIDCFCTARVKGTYDIFCGCLMLEYDTSSLDVDAYSSDVTIFGGNRGFFEYYDRSELANEAKADVYRSMFVSCKEFNELGSYLISEITDNTFVFEDDDLGTVTAYRQKSEF